MHTKIVIAVALLLIGNALIAIGIVTGNPFRLSFGVWWSLLGLIYFREHRHDRALREVREEISTLAAKIDKALTKTR